MIINIASFGGRSHMLDLARELEKSGHKVRFYSFVPTKRALKFGLKRKCSYSYFTIAIPFLFLLKITKRAHWALFLFHYCFDHLTAWFMKPCDIFIGQSPMHVYSLKYARKKFGALIILERGTSHVFEQIKVLVKNPALNGRNPMPDMFLKRDLKGYQISDFISIASDHVLQSFVRNNYPLEKLFVNPYGVSIGEFKPTNLDERNQYDIIMVGGWSYRKGCDLLVEACRKKNYSLLHLGSLVDLNFPPDQNMHHIGAVEQRELINYYKKAKVFVLPSREEGLALVQVQAVACGLPVVCSKFTGGRDLRKFTSDSKWIIEMEELSIDGLIESIDKALKLSEGQRGLRQYSTRLEDEMSWDAYGNRYNEFLNSIKNT